MRDEEDDVARFTHSTVKEFLCGKLIDDEKYHMFRLDSDEMNHNLGKVCVTYLNFNDFVTQLSTRPRESPRLPSKAVVNTTLLSALSPPIRKAISRTAPTLLRTRHQPSDLRPRLSFASIRNSHLERCLGNNYALFDYAANCWIFHTSRFSKEDPQMWDLWKSLIFARDDLVSKPWTAREFQDRDRALARFIKDEQHFALLQAIEESDQQLGSRNIRWLLKSCIKDRHVQLLDEVLKRCKISGTLKAFMLQPAAESGCGEIVERLLQAGAEVNTRVAPYINRALQSAAASGFVDVVQTLLAAGAEADPQLPTDDDEDKIALQAAVANGHVDVVDRLLAAGAQVNRRSISGWTAIRNAAERGDTEIVDKLLLAGAIVNPPPVVIHTTTPLQAAAERGHLGVVERLLTAGAHVDTTTVPGAPRTALQYAAKAGHASVVKVLLAAGAHIEAKPEQSPKHTPLQLASGAGHTRVVEVLLGAGAEINAGAPEDGQTPFQLALVADHTDVMIQLRAAGARFEDAIRWLQPSDQSENIRARWYEYSDLFELMELLQLYENIGRFQERQCEISDSVRRFLENEGRPKH